MLVTIVLMMPLLTKTDKTEQVIWRWEIITGECRHQNEFMKRHVEETDNSGRVSRERGSRPPTLITLKSGMQAEGWNDDSKHCGDALWSKIFWKVIFLDR